GRAYFSQSGGDARQNSGGWRVTPPRFLGMDPVSAAPTTAGILRAVGHILANQAAMLVRIAADGA
ncbi:hypothetical protein CQA89_32920, partial [Klebsiella pneumoniae]